MKTLRQLREGIAVKSNVQWLLPTFTIISGLVERGQRTPGVYPTIYHFVADEFSRDSLYVSREESYEHDPLFLDIVQPKIDKWDMLLRDSWEDARKIV